MSSHSVPLSLSQPSFCSKNCTFQDDSYLPIALTAMPVVGVVVQVIKEVITIPLKIRDELRKGQAANAQKIVDLVQTKNKYTLASAVRNTLVGIALITLVACGILNPIAGGIFAGLFLLGAALNAWRTYHNITHIIKPHQEGKEINITQLR